MVNATEKERRGEEGRLGREYCERGHELTVIKGERGAFWCDTCRDKYYLPKDLPKKR